MSAVFEGYERQYCELSANVSRKCNSFAASGSGTFGMFSLSNLTSVRVNLGFCCSNFLYLVSDLKEERWSELNFELAFCFYR